jgi:hypothetical protein
MGGDGYEIWSRLLPMLHQWRILCPALKSGRFLELIQVVKHNARRYGRLEYARG